MLIYAGFWHSVRWWMNLPSKGKFIMSNFQVYFSLVSVHRAEIIMTSILASFRKLDVSVCATDELAEQVVEENVACS
jgi:hypothetical protein